MSPARQSRKAKRIAPTATLFVGTGMPAEKALLLCFQGRGDRSMMIPNPVLLQHSESAAYDVLMLSEPRGVLATSYHIVP